MQLFHNLLQFFIFKNINFTLLYHSLDIISLKCTNIEPVSYKHSVDKILHLKNLFGKRNFNWDMSIIYIHINHISRPIRRTFFPEKCDRNSTCFLCAEGKYYFQTYKYLYIYYTTSLSWDSEICFQIMGSSVTACERLTFLSGYLP